MLFIENDVIIDGMEHTPHIVPTDIHMKQNADDEFIKTLSSYPKLLSPDNERKLTKNM